MPCASYNGLGAPYPIPLLISSVIFFASPNGISALLRQCELSTIQLFQQCSNNIHQFRKVVFDYRPHPAVVHARVAMNEKVAKSDHLPEPRHFGGQIWVGFDKQVQCFAYYFKFSFNGRMGDLRGLISLSIYILNKPGYSRGCLQNIPQITSGITR